MMGTVFDIKEMTVHDGPGSRVTVFLKGCPLRCLWCHNPEGLSKAPQLMVKENLCEACGLCRMPCEHSECAEFGRCVHACPKGLVSIAGEEMSAEALALKLSQYKSFLNNVGGGITFSGGEPLLQAEFVCQTAELLPDMHKALQTSGYASREDFERVISKMNYVLFDIKLADSVLHKKYTGVSNGKILENYKLLKASGIPYVVRVPLIPSITDTPDNLRQISRIVGSDRVELMRYNSFAPAKYKTVGMEFPLKKLESSDIDVSVFENAVIL